MRPAPAPARARTSSHAAGVRTTSVRDSRAVRSSSGSPSRQAAMNANASSAESPDDGDGRRLAVQPPEHLLALLAAAGRREGYRNRGDGPRGPVVPCPLQVGCTARIPAEHGCDPCVRRRRLVEPLSSESASYARTSFHSRSARFSVAQLSRLSTAGGDEDEDRLGLDQALRVIVPRVVVLVRLACDVLVNAHFPAGRAVWNPGVPADDVDQAVPAAQPGALRSAEVDGPQLSHRAWATRMRASSGSSYLAGHPVSPRFELDRVGEPAARPARSDGGATGPPCAGSKRGTRPPEVEPPVPPGAVGRRDAAVPRVLLHRRRPQS